MEGIITTMYVAKINAKFETVEEDFGKPFRIGRRWRLFVTTYNTATFKPLGRVVPSFTLPNETWGPVIALLKVHLIILQVKSLS